MFRADYSSVSASLESVVVSGSQEQPGLSRRVSRYHMIDTWYLAPGTGVPGACVHRYQRTDTWYLAPVQAVCLLPGALHSSLSSNQEERETDHWAWAVLWVPGIIYLNTIVIISDL